MAELNPGSKAPDFTLLNDRGEKLKLSSLQGQTVILYFYPKANTPGCTKQACEFGERFPEFENLQAVILGVSPDPVKAIAKFRQKYSLPFTLLADEEHVVAGKYGVWVEKSMYGKSYMGVERSTFVVGPDGKISHVFRKVKPESNPGEVLKALRG
jgi:peroxiredoxin Q/BCP